VEITRLIRDVIYERTDTRRPPSGERIGEVRRPSWQFATYLGLIKEIMARIALKRPVPLSKVAYFALRHVRYQRGAWIKNFWRAARDVRFYEPAVGGKRARWSRGIL